MVTNIPAGRSKTNNGSRCCCCFSRRRRRMVKSTTISVVVVGFIMLLSLCFTDAFTVSNVVVGMRTTTIKLSKSFERSSSTHAAATTATSEPTTTTSAAPAGTSSSKGSNNSGIDITMPCSNNDMISVDDPLRVLIAGAGVGGLALANSLTKIPHIHVTVLEQASEFKRFGGPIQLASNAMQVLKTMDRTVYNEIKSKFTVTGDKMNGIKDGIRTEWYAKFDLKTPAKDRNMPYTGVIDRPDLQEIYLEHLPAGIVRNGDGVSYYNVTTTTSTNVAVVATNNDAATVLSTTSTTSSANNNNNNKGGGLVVTLNSGQQVYGDVLIGADGIWSAVRATMHEKPKRGDESGATYSGYTVFAGELEYESPDNGQVGYKVYIGPGQYFVITDIGKGNYQWYAFLARPPGTAETIDMPNGTSKYLQDVFTGWSNEIHAILRVTKEHEIEQRDLYDRPPSIDKPWTSGHVALLGDGIHAMMPNLGQGGCQAIEDAYVICQELQTCTQRSTISDRLRSYANRRLIRSAAVQGLSRFASDIIIRGFDTPAKISRDPNTGSIKLENFGYAGIVTKMLQPILPIFFKIQFNFLYDGWKNENLLDIRATLGFLTLGGAIALLLFGTVAGEVGGSLIGVEAFLGAEGIFDADVITTAIRDFFDFL